MAGITYRFAGAGRRKWLVEQRDRAGRWVQFHRNHSGLVTKVVHHGGYQVLVIASGSRVAALDLATAEGPVRLATFDYRHGSLIAETPAGAGTTRYEVDEVDRISAWVDANDVRYRHHYDDRDRCVSQGTENAGHERVHRYAYTYSDGPLPGGQTMVVHYPNGANERYESDQDGRVVRVVGPLGGVTQHTFDQWGRRTSVTDPLGPVSYTHLVLHLRRRPNPHRIRHSGDRRCAVRIRLQRGPTAALQLVSDQTLGRNRWFRTSFG